MQNQTTQALERRIAYLEAQNIQLRTVFEYLVNHALAPSISHDITHILNEKWAVCTTCQISIDITNLKEHKCLLPECDKGCYCDESNLN